MLEVRASVCEFGGGRGQREHKHTVYNTTSNHFSSGLALELRREELFEEARLWVGGREEKGRIKYSINVSLFSPPAIIFHCTTGRPS